MSENQATPAVHPGRRLAAVRRRPFRRFHDFVAVKPIRLTRDHQLQPGEAVELPRWQLMSLYKRRVIGAADDPWTAAMLEAYTERLEREAARQALPDENTRQEPARSPVLAYLRSMVFGVGDEASEAAPLGTETLPAEFLDTTGERRPQADLAVVTADLMELSTEEWNALPADRREAHLRDAAELLEWQPAA